MPFSRFEFMFNHLEKDNSMQALEKLGLVLDEPIGLSELLSEDFNPQLYRLTEAQEEKINGSTRLSSSIHM